VLPLEMRTTRRQRDARRGWGNVRKRIVRTRFREELNRASSATRRTRIAREEGGRAAVLRRPRGVIVSPRVRARSRGLSTDARGGRARARVPGKHSRSARNGQRKNMASLRRPCRTGGARTRTHLSPCPSFHESLNPPAATLRSTRDMTWKGGSAARASTPQGSPDRSRARAAPRRALPDRPDRCPTRTGVWRDERRGAGSRSRRGRRGSRSPQLRKEISAVNAIACRSRKTCRSKPRGQAPVDAFQRPEILRCSLYGHLVWKRDGFFGERLCGFLIHARVANAASRTDTRFC
jgi:hypothetical protein